MQQIGKGIILAGGSGTRLYPLTQVMSKQLLPVYDKPMIYYPLSTLMLAGIRDVLVINTPHEQALFQKLLGDGSQWGISIRYAAQPSPDGLAQAFLIGREFVDGEPSCLILGDNIFYGHGLTEVLRNARARARTARRCSATGCAIRSATASPNSMRSGKVDRARGKTARSRARTTPSPGLYFYDQRVCDFAAELKPSPRGELEITDLNRAISTTRSLMLEKLGRGYAWLDTGTHESLVEASNYIETIENRQGLKVSCPEEIAYRATAGSTPSRCCASPRRWPRTATANTCSSSCGKGRWREDHRDDPAGLRRHRARRVRRRARLFLRKLQCAKVSKTPAST